MTDFSPKASYLKKDLKVIHKMTVNIMCFLFLIQLVR